jgi:hypothetical protein
MDRANLKLGRLKINIFVVGIVHKTVAFPIVLISLRKQGNSNTAERNNIINQFIDIFGIIKFNIVTAEHKFIDQLSFAYLLVN